MNKVYEPGRQGRDWDFEGLMAMAAIFVSNAGTPEDITKVKGLPDIGLPEVRNEAVTLGQRSMEGQGSHPNTFPSSIDEPNRDPSQPRQFQSGHQGKNRRLTRSSGLSGTDDNTPPVVTDRIDDLSPHAGSDGDPPRSVGRKRPASERYTSPKGIKRRKPNPPPKAPPDRGPSTSFPPAHTSEGYEASRGGRKSKAEPLSKMRGDYYYRQNTSPDDQTYFNDAIERLRGNSYLRDPQTQEPTISSEPGQALLRVVRVEGPGRAKEDESVYAVFVDKPSSGPFCCWICGHSMERKVLRALGHVREHFGHRPWQCTQDHRTGTVKDENGKPKRRRANGRDGPW